MVEGDLVPDVELESSDGSKVSLRRPGLAVFYVFPKSGRPGIELPPGWGDEPGMTGCSAQSCSFRDLHDDLRTQGAEIFGISTLTPEQQRDFAAGLSLSYPLLSDAEYVLEREVDLPTASVNDSLKVYKRLTFITRDGRVAKVFYPVLTPAENAAEVLAWLDANRMRA